MAGLAAMKGCEKMGAAPSADQISSLGSITESGAKCPPFFGGHHSANPQNQKTRNEAKTDLTLVCTISYKAAEATAVPLALHSLR